MNRFAAPSTIRTVYAICMAGAASNHVADIASHGLTWDHGGLPAAVCGFWTSLAFFDALATILLFAKPQAGVALATAIIASDVAVNTWALFSFTLPMNPDLKAIQMWPYFAQLAFLLFVAATVRRAWGPRRAGQYDLEYIQAFVPQGIGESTKR